MLIIINKRLSDIIYALEEKKDLKRIRYTTSHPKDMTKDLLMHIKIAKANALITPASTIRL